MFKTDFIFRQQKTELKQECLAWSCYYETGCFDAFLGDFFTLKWGNNMKKHILLSSSKAFLLSTPVENNWGINYFYQCSAQFFSCLSTPTFKLSIPMENIVATWKKATKCNKIVNCSKSNEVSDLGFIHNKAFMMIGWAPFWDRSY